MRSKYNYINPQDFARILSAIPSLKIRKWLDSDITMLFELLYWLALRPDEAIYLEKADFHLDDLQVSLGNTKTRSLDEAQIPPQFRERLANYLDKKKDGRLFEGLTYHPFYMWIIRLGAMLNIEAWTMDQSETHEKTKGHIMRKSMAKDMLFGLHGEVMQNITYVSGHLRHKKPSTTMDHYLKASGAAVGEAWKRAYENIE